jgi:hypothetical protein
MNDRSIPSRVKPARCAARPQILQLVRGRLGPLAKIRQILFPQLDFPGARRAMSAAWRCDRSAMASTSRSRTAASAGSL